MDCLTDDVKLEIMGWCDTFLGMGKCAVTGTGFAHQLKLAQSKLQHRRKYGAREASERLKQHCSRQLPIRVERAPPPAAPAEHPTLDVFVVGPKRVGELATQPLNRADRPVVTRQVVPGEKTPPAQFNEGARRPSPARAHSAPTGPHPRTSPDPSTRCPIQSHNG